MIIFDLLHPLRKKWLFCCCSLNWLGTDSTSFHLHWLSIVSTIIFCASSLSFFHVYMCVVCIYVCVHAHRNVGICVCKQVMYMYVRGSKLTWEVSFYHSSLYSLRQILSIEPSATNKCCHRELLFLPFQALELQVVCNAHLAFKWALGKNPLIMEWSPKFLWKFSLFLNKNAFMWMWSMNMLLARVSYSTSWVPWIKFKFSDLTASTFTCWAI